MKLPTFSSYGPYASSNYGVNALRFDIGTMSIYFSYQTPVAFAVPGRTVCRVNDWNVTTGKHLNVIEPNKKSRVPGDVFEAELSAELKRRGMAI